MAEKATQVVIVTKTGTEHTFPLQGNFTTIVKYVNQARAGKFEPGEDGTGSSLAVIDTGNGRLVIDGDQVESIREDK